MLHFLALCASRRYSHCALMCKVYSAVFITLRLGIFFSNVYSSVYVCYINYMYSLHNYMCMYPRFCNCGDKSFRSASGIWNAWLS